MTAAARKKILLFTDWFEPGYRAGGPITSAVNFVMNMEDEFDIAVITSDRDHGADRAYENVEADTWINYGRHSKVFYCSPESLSRHKIRKLMADENPDFVYLNSMYSKPFTLFPLLTLIWSKSKSKIILAPRGMLKQSALNFKRTKKQLFFAAFKVLGVSKHIFFQATDEAEIADIKRKFGDGTKVALAPNFPGLIRNDVQPIVKKKGELDIIFVGRIHPIKGLDILLESLRKVNAIIRLTIIGPVEDEPYAQQCYTLAKQLPASVKTDFAGEQTPASIQKLLAEHHVFCLPTQGENFGHAIFEALTAGRPALISDQTPWRGLESKNAGWDLPLVNKDLFASSINQAVSFEQAEYELWSRSAAEFAKSYIAKINFKEAYYNIFN